MIKVVFGSVLICKSCDRQWRLPCVRVKLSACRFLERKYQVLAVVRKADGAEETIHA